MKTFIILFILLIAFSVSAETAHYSVKEGKLHKGGAVTIETLEGSEDFKVKLNYELYKRSWVPVPNDQLKGETITTLPPQFKDERGYLELEQVKEITIPEAKVKFVKRVDFRNFKDAYLIEVNPTNGKSSNQIIYHPSIPAAGWGSVEIRFISHISALNGYKIIAEIKE